MTERKYSVASIGTKIDGFLSHLLDNGGFKVGYEIGDSRSPMTISKRPTWW